MKIKKIAQPLIEVEFEIGAEDITIIFDEPHDNNLDHWLRQMNDIAVFLKGTSPSIIGQLNQAQGELIAGALRELADRIGETHTS